MASALIGLSKVVGGAKAVFGGLQSAVKVGKALSGIAKGSQAASSALTFMAGSSNLLKVR